MLKSFRLPILAMCVFAAPLAAQDAEAALAAKLVGSWEGRWTFADAGGKATMKITAATGAALKGTTKWFDTAVGDFEDTIKKTKLKGAKLEVTESTMDFEVQVADDGKTLTGTWTSPMASGGLTLKKVD